MNIIDRIDNYLNNNIDINKRIDNYLANYKEDSTKNQNRTNNVSSKKKDKKIYTFNHALSVMNPQNEEPNQSKKREQIYGFQNNNLFKNTNKMNFNTDTKSSISNEQLKEIEKMNKKLNNSGINQQINFAKIGDKAENTNKYTKNIQAIMKSNKEYDNKKAKKEVATQFAVTPILVLKGAAKDVEGKIDTMIDLSDKINNKLLNVTGNISNKEYDRRRENTRRFIAENRVENLVNEYGIDKILNTGEKYSLSKRDNLLGKTAEGVGGMLPTIAISRLAKIPMFTAKTLKGLTFGGKLLTLGKNIGTHMLVNSPTTASFSSKVYGGALEEAYAEGATDEQARNYAIASTAVEIASEWITGGVPGTNGVGGIDIFVDKGIDKITNQLTKSLVKYGYNVIGEGAEEILSEILNPIIKNATYSSGNTINWDDVVESFIVGGLTAGVLELPNSYMNYKQNKVYENYDEVVNQLKETKKNISDNETKTKIDNLINEINNAKTSDTDTDINKMNAKINDYINLRKQQSLNKEQKKDISKLEQKLNELQNIKNNQNVDVRDNQNEINLPTVQDIVNQEKLSQSGINLPVYNQQSNISNSDKAILPTVNDFSSSNINMPTSDIKVDMAKISPEILNDIKGFKLGDPSIESYKGSYIKTMLNEVGIKVPTAMNYVSEVRPDMSFTTTKDLTRQQYASIGNALQKLKSVDITGVNNINEITANNILPVNVSQINQVKGNIPINQELLNKYNNVSEMINKNINKYDGKVDVKSSIAELNNIDLNSMSQNELSNLATNIFEKYNSSNTFINDGNKIMVTRSGIKESINKILYNKNQKKYLKEHLQVFSDLGDIIESATLASQTTEGKSRENNKIWNYYLNGLNINDNNYLFEFDVVSRQNGENHYRVQRLEKINSKKANASVENTITSVTPTLETSAFSSDNIPQSNNNVNSGILPTINNMQNSEENTNKILNPNENISKNFELDYTPQDPTKESTYDEPKKLAEILKEKPNTIEEKDNWLKKLATIKFIDKGYYVDKLARKVKNKELSSKYDYSLLSNGIANQIIGNGRVDEKGNKVGKGLYEIFEPIENSGLLDDFSRYIYHKHNIDRMSLQNRFNEANKAVFGDAMTSDMSEKIVNEYETKYPEFESWADDIYEYNNANLEMLVKYGVLSKDSMEYYNKKYPHYVPTIREQTKTKTQMDFLLGKKASVNNPIKKAKGGNGNIIPLKDAMALRTMQTVNSALRNNFGLELLNSIETEQIRKQENIDNIVEEINSDELLTKSSETSPATLTVFDKGEKVTFDISDEIYEALKPSNIKTFKFLNKLNNIRRGLLTEYNPTFMITNPLKDIQDGSINSKHPKLFIKNLPEAIKQIKNNGQYKQLYIANGGSYETYFNYNTGTNIAPSKLDKIAPLKKISEINELIEMAPRLAEFISSIEAGDSIETAMYNASEITTNFKRGGDITKTLDRNGVTFLNAGVQGTTKQVRNVQEARVEGIKGITRLAVRWTIAGLVPTLLMNMIWGDDDDYEELSDYVKNNYYIIGKYNNGEFIRIPKGRVVSVLQSFFQNALNGVEGKKIDLKGFADLIENNLLPSDPNESSLIAPIKQAINNETWYGGDLVPTRLQNLPNAEQYDETTDSISIWLGKMLNISPYKINYVLDQYAGAIGDYTLPYLTQAAESGSDSFTGKLLAPIKDKFTVDSSLKNQNISDFYSLSEELTKKSNSSSATDEDILKNKYINSVKSEISKLYAKKREIQSSSLKDSEKYNQSKEVQNEINELSEKALDNYSKVELYDNYAIINDKEYYKNNNDEWTKIDTTNAKYKTAKLITRYNDYLSYDNKIKELKKQYNSSNSRKIAIIKYVNSLDLTIPQKAMLIKMNYSSYNDYNNQIINYINKQSISLEDKKEILEELGFKVRNGRVYTK